MTTAVTSDPLVGGTSLIPAVQRTLGAYFGDQAVQVDKPFTAVAEGALRVAAGFGLEDQLVHSYGLRYLDPETGEHAYDEIIPMGSRYPTRKSVQVVLGTAHPDQEAVEFVVGQIDTSAVSMVEVQYQDGQAVFVAQADRSAQQIAPLNRPDEWALAPLDPPGTPGEDRLRAEFIIDAQRRLRLTVVDLRSGKRLLDDVALVTLGEARSEEKDRHSGRHHTGHEPALSSYSQPGQRRLSLRGLATSLNLLPPESISLQAIAEALRSPDCTVRYSAAETLSKRGDRDARRIVQDVLDHGTVPQRASVVWHLHRLSWFAAEPLLRQALADGDERVRESAIYCLSKVRTREAYHLMVEVLHRETDTVRMAAARGLNNSRDARAVPVLEIALQAQDPRVREMALESLGSTEATEAIPVARQAMDDAELDVKYAAALSLLELAGEAVLSEFAAIVGRTRGLERRCIARALFHATNYLQIDIAQSPAALEVIAALEAALEDDLPEARLAAALPLVRMDHARARAALRAGYDREPDSEVKARMLYYAVLLEAALAGELLADALQSQDPDLRETAEDLAAYLAQH
jgi:HEAT repeat protein